MSDSSTEVLKERVQQYVDDNAQHLIDISHTIHANPEIAFEEYESMALLAGEAEAAGDIQFDKHGHAEVSTGMAGPLWGYQGVGYPGPA